MSTFTDAEVAYLNDQVLGRLATAGADHQPHVVPVGFRYNAETETIDIGGLEMASTKKFRDAEQNPQVAFIVDDLASTDPWRPRGIEVRGQAQTFKSGGGDFGPNFGESWIQIKPRRIIAWGIDSDSFKASRRSVE